MSIYYQCRFMDIKVDISGRDDIKEFIKSIECGTKSKVIPQCECDYSPSCEISFNNPFIDEGSIDINVSINNDVIILDLCLGTKCLSSIENLLFLLKPYIISGSTFFSNENVVHEVDLVNSFTSCHIDCFDFTVGDLEYIDIDISVERFRNKINQTTIAEYDAGKLYSDDDVLSSLLHVGLTTDKYSHDDFELYRK